MPTLTTNFNLKKPTVGADDNDWGDFLNEALDIIDAKLKALEIPIGGLYLSVSATNPATSLGYGTWVAHAAGRALVGVGSNGETAWAVGDERGSETHTLTTAQLPSHTHSFSANTDSQGSHSHGVTASVGVTALSGSFEIRNRANTGGILANGSGIVSVGDTGGSQNTMSTDSNERARGRVTIVADHNHTVSVSLGSAGAHTHSVSGTTGAAGSGNAHNNIQPSIAVHVWRRTA
jgi:microcystin-dependent protein